jgi:hypothetical protein
MGKSIASRIAVRSDSITHAEITAVAVIVGETGRTGRKLESVLRLSRSLKTNAVNHSSAGRQHESKRKTGREES